tara:strand:- start:56 stop:589 length:534 start_codon:yes stop_codon:yes gene_type:complete
MFVYLFLFLTLCYAKEYKAVDELKLNYYIGKWYQVYGDNFNKLFQGNGKCSSAIYSFYDESTISVLNYQLDKDNSYSKIKGFAYYKENNCCGYLTVQLADLPESPYWVLELGPIVDGLYDYSLVSDDKALSLYVLTRDVNRFYQDYNETVLDSLKEFGFTKKYNHPVIMDQTDCVEK